VAASGGSVLALSPTLAVDATAAGGATAGVLGGGTSLTNQLVEMRARGGSGGGSQPGGRGTGDTTEYIKTMNNRTLRYVEDRVPDSWKKMPSNTGKGWKWVDEKGIERIRYMYPDEDGKFIHEQEGYWRWQNAKGEWLDETGRVVDKSDPLFQQKTHIIIAK
jgi:hypothetical protein